MSQATFALGNIPYDLNQWDLEVYVLCCSESEVIIVHDEGTSL